MIVMFDFEKKAAQIRLNSLLAMYKAGVAYTGSSMSLVEILLSLYYGEIFGRKVIKFDAQKPGSDEQDYLVLSKYQAAPVLYAILADLGFFDQSELDFLGKPAAMLPLFPSAKVPGISTTVMNQGQGLSMAVGTALSLKMDRKSNRVFTILGDTELQYGQVWEAAMMAAHHKLDNLITLIDYNKVQANGLISGVVDIVPIQDKFEAFGWKVMQVTDGHNCDQILNTIMKAYETTRRPVCIWCHTICGKGVGFAEGNVFYQNAVLSEGEIQEIISKLEVLI